MNLSPEDFVQKILFEECHCRMAVCGFNYTYGAKGAGTPKSLAQTFGALPECRLSVVDSVCESSAPISSSAIRALLEQGCPERATLLLGRPYSITGKVTRGKHLGNTMGFPTANLAFPAGRLIPAHGVYLCTVRVGRREHYGICNVGIRPTFNDGDRVNCEAFIFDFDGDLYGKTIRVSFLRYLRKERRFTSEEELREQIRRDVAEAQRYL